MPRSRTLFSCLTFAFFFTVAALFSATSAVSQENAAIGRVIAVAGSVQALQGGKMRILSIKAPVYLKDTLQTGPDGKAQIIFNDDTTLNMGVNTTLEMQDFADQGAAPRFKARMTQGLARIITGRIVEQNPKGFSFATPDATVGIRGTIIGFQVTPGLTRVALFNSMGKGVVINGQSLEDGTVATFSGGRLTGREAVRPQTVQDYNRGLLIGSGQAPPATRAPREELFSIDDLNTQAGPDAGALPPGNQKSGQNFGRDSDQSPGQTSGHSPAGNDAQAEAIALSLAEAETLYRNGNPLEAYAIFSRLLRETPDDDHVNLGLARSAMRAERPNQAIMAYERLLARYPDEPALYRELAEAYTAVGDPLAARLCQDKELCGIAGQ